MYMAVIDIDNMRYIVNAADNAKNIFKNVYRSLMNLSFNYHVIVDELKHYINSEIYKTTYNEVCDILTSFEVDHRDPTRYAMYMIFNRAKYTFKVIEAAAEADYSKCIDNNATEVAVKYAEEVKLSINIMNSYGYHNDD